MPVISDVPSFNDEPAAGNRAFLAAQAALSVVGLGRGLPFLAGASGDAFKFVYDTGAVREHLRDLRPWDSLAAAYAACGLRAEWVPEATLDHVRGQVEAHARIGQPILSSGLPHGDGGCCLLVGYDEDRDRLISQHAADVPGAATPYRVLDLADDPAWEGPVTGPPYRVDFPMLVIRGPLYDPPDESTQRRAALQRALDVLNGAPIAYDVAGVKQAARQGLAAFQALTADLETVDLGDADLAWKLDALLAQYAWDRDLAALYLESWAGDAPADLIALYRSAAHGARTLLTRVLERRSAAMADRDSLRGFVTGTGAYCYLLPEAPGIRQGLDDLGSIIETPHGPALLVATDSRRAGAARLARRLHDLEASATPLLAGALQRL